MLKTIKNKLGKTICKVDEENQRIHIRYKGSETELWFDPLTGKLRQINVEVFEAKVKNIKPDRAPPDDS